MARDISDTIRLYLGWCPNSQEKGKKCISGQSIFSRFSHQIPCAAGYVGGTVSGTWRAEWL